MFDGLIRTRIDPPLNTLGERVAMVGISANQVTTFGLVVSVAAGVAIALGWFVAALVFIALSRFADGLDGAIARATRKTDLGGYLDIVFDFVFYAAVPLGFVLHDPAANGIAGAVLLAAFYVNGATFLAFAAVAARRGMSTEIRGPKSIYFTTGLAEGSETIFIFVAMCVLPAWFAAIAYGFAAVCVITAGARVALAVTTFRDR
jgi:phosphatidylglycerophosphate synthase